MNNSRVSIAVSAVIFCAGVGISTIYRDVVADDSQRSVIAASGNTIKEFVISDSFREALKEQNFVVNPPQLVEKPKMIGNMNQIKSFFSDNNETLFFSYRKLNTFYIKNTANKSSAEIFCFQFDSDEAAKTWVDVIDKTTKKGKRKAIFRKPKKLIGLAGNYVILLEGYRMSNYSSLRFIMSKLDEVNLILDGETTKVVDKAKL